MKNALLKRGKLFQHQEVIHPRPCVPRRARHQLPCGSIHNRTTETTYLGGINNGKKEKKYQVFISSTYEDLKEERSAISQTLLKADCIPVGMEQFPASNMSQMEYIEKMLKNCDYFILIIGGRYGSIDPEDGIGYTEKEYDYAIAHNIPVMSFLYHDFEELPANKVEKTDAGREKLCKFREKASNGKMRNTYTSIDNLQTIVALSLQQCIKDFPRPGWVRGDIDDVGLSFEEKTLGEKIDEHLKKLTIRPDEINQIYNSEDSSKSSPRIIIAPVYQGAISEPLENADLKSY